MSYLVWRLHRNQVYLACAALAVLTVVLLITGIRMSHDYRAFLANCAAAHSCGNGSNLFGGDSDIFGAVYATMAVPLLFGLFWGAPLLASEFETGTHSLAWTQGVTRRRWLSRTVMWALLAAAVWGAALAILISWWRTPENALNVAGGRFDAGQFDIQGIAPVAYSVFAVALGVAAGALLLVSSPVIGPGGHDYGSSFPSAGQAPAACRPGVSPSCLTSHGFRMVVSYQPAGRFWAFQGIEAGIYIVLAAALVAVAYRMVLGRDA